MSVSFFPRSRPTTPPTPVATIIALMACGLVHVRFQTLGDEATMEQVRRLGYVPAEGVFAGDWWALFTSVFVHFDLWHLAFNAYWLWLLGSRLERAIGTLPYLLFFAAAGFASSTWQLAISDDTGIGASGVVYAIFGFMWIARRRHPDFGGIIDERTIRLFLLWMVACIVISAFGLLHIGNAAHVSGLAFGALAGTSTFSRRLRVPALAATALALALSVVPAFWAPWSPTWNGRKAYLAHVAEHYPEALGYYDRVIALDPENAWALYNRSLVHEELGDPEAAALDLARAYNLDPSLKD